MTLHAITSEIFTENANTCLTLKNGNTISKFVFKCPSYLIAASTNAIKYDADEDLDVDREVKKVLLIEHKTSTQLEHVGLQVWRGALLLADYILSNPSLFEKQVILELGSGVGLTSIVASFLAKQVICTDVDVEQMLWMIRRNYLRNATHVKSRFFVKEVNFLDLDWVPSLKKKLEASTIILAADVIYDETITKGFVRTLAQLFNSKIPKTAYIALEQRYVFTISDMDTTAPMYDEFLRCVAREKLDWSIEYVKIDFPKYFDYDRVKHMILMKIQPN